jgi:hypothetical protein
MSDLDPLPTDEPVPEPEPPKPDADSGDEQGGPLNPEEEPA